LSVRLTLERSVWKINRACESGQAVDACRGLKASGAGIARHAGIAEPLGTCSCGAFGWWKNRGEVLYLSSAGCGRQENDKGNPGIESGGGPPDENRYKLSDRETDVTASARGE